MHTVRSIARVVAASLLGTFLFAAAPARAEIKVGYSDWPGWVAWAIAEQKGYFKKYGAKVKLVWFSNYSDSISALSAGQLDANCQTWSDTMAPLAKGIPLKVVLVNDNSAGNDALMTGPAIKSFAALKGRKIALEEYSVSHFLLATALNRNGMTPKDVNIVNMAAGDAAAAFISGRVDAAVVWNPWVNKIELSGKGKPLFSSKEVPGLIPDLLVAQEKSLAANRQDYAGMIRAWYDVVKFLREHPDEAVKIMSKVVGLSPDEYKVFLPGTHFFDQKANLEAFGTDTSTTKTLVGSAPTILKFLDENKLIDGKPDYAKALDGSLVRQIAK
ncbi:MAG: aliphatic sulfonate ABC transporter substrate-binding protein [Betaproteobacteria bacterium]|nr:aliphatic sulfonate ABC transporter substrate-binding protein [Betaproteobacteria bacterium]